MMARKNFVNIEWLKNLAEETKHIKQRSYDLLQVQPDSQVLDVGCGPAVDTIPLSGYIGDKGRIVGVDYDPVMVEAADQELAKTKISKRVQHIQGNVFALPFQDGEFDRVHLERFFQVFPKDSADQIFAELNRVLKKNGRIVIVDMDMATLSVNFGDNEFERKLINYFGLKMRPNGYAGRQLIEILRNNDYKEVSVELMPHSFGNLTRKYFMNWIITGALDSKFVTQNQADNWKHELDSRVKEGTFLAYITNVLVTGLKP
ncbi:methyltransferase domain-containing protein [Candidatus Bathyarchaeota archaeon]|nr:methyltransferase domain-containing protein [Candidatus Bathyarchaeota archaeon]